MLAVKITTRLKSLDSLGKFINGLLLYAKYIPKELAVFQFELCS